MGGPTETLNDLGHAATKKDDMNDVNNCPSTGLGEDEDMDMGADPPLWAELPPLPPLRLPHEQQQQQQQRQATISSTVGSSTGAETEPKPRRPSLFHAIFRRWDEENEKLDAHITRRTIMESAQGVLSMFLVMLSGLLTDIFPLQFQTYLTNHAVLRYVVIFFLVLYSVTALSGINSFKQAMVQSIVVSIIFVTIIQLHPLITFLIFTLISIMVACFPTDFDIVSDYLMPVVILLTLGGIVHWLVFWRKRSKQLDIITNEQHAADAANLVNTANANAAAAAAAASATASEANASAPAAPHAATGHHHSHTHTLGSATPVSSKQGGISSLFRPGTPAGRRILVPRIANRNQGPTSTFDSHSLLKQQQPPLSPHTTVSPVPAASSPQPSPS